MVEELISLKPVIDEMVANEGFHIKYTSFIQGYKNGKMPEALIPFIVEKKKFSSSSYYLKKADIGKFKEAVFKQFN